MVEVKEQTEEIVDTKELQRKLRSYTNKWAVVVLEEMNKIRPTEKSKIYNVLCGNITDKTWRKIFVTAANRAIERLEAEYRAA